MPSKMTIDRHTLQHGTKVANHLLQQLSDLAASRLLQIFTHRQDDIIKLKPNDPLPSSPVGAEYTPPLILYPSNEGRP